MEYKCSKCTFTTTNKTSLINHKKQKHNMVYTNCNICNEPHFEEEKHECKRCLCCGKEIQYKRGSNHNEKKFCSRSCSASYTNKGKKKSNKTKEKIRKSLETKIISIKEFNSLIKKNNITTMSELRKYSQPLYRKLLKIKKTNVELFNKYSKNLLSKEEKQKLDLENRKKELEEIAKNYKTRFEFYNFDKKNYDRAWIIDRDYESGFIDKICSHMEELGSLHKRLIYGIFFESENKVYIGLTCNTNSRFSSHKNNSSNKNVRKLIKEGKKATFVKLTDFMEVEKAKRAESKFIDSYKKQGYTLLNSAKAGGIGTVKNGYINSKEYKKMIENALSECNTYEEFKGHKKAYALVRHYKIIDKVKKYFKNRKVKVFVN